jgi:glycosyltransferase involved in cell wall biosynthesis
MRSILICNELITSGGLGTYTLTLAEGLRKRGWEIHFLVTHGHNDDYYANMKKIASRCHDLSLLSLSYKKLKIAIDIVNDIEPDILLLNHCSLLHYSLPFIFATIKPVSILHNDIELIYNVARRCSKRIFRWITPSKALAEHFRHYVEKNSHDRIKVIQHGVDVDRFFNKRSFSVLKRPRISFIGNIGIHKGADILPDIFELVKRGFKDIEITIIGEGPLRISLEERLNVKGIKASFTGYITREQINEILNNTEILLLPTRVEGFGLVIVEAMLCGAVPISSCLLGITDDIIENGVTGILVESGNVDGFANAVVSLLKNHEKLISMSKTARETALSRYSAEIMLDKYEAIFSEEDDRMAMSRLDIFGLVAEIIREKTRKIVDRK